MYVAITSCVVFIARDLLKLLSLPEKARPLVVAMNCVSPFQVMSYSQFFSGAAGCCESAL
jgi:hypothetical protein